MLYTITNTSFQSKVHNSFESCEMHLYTYAHEVHKYTEFSIIRNPIILMRTLGRRLLSPCFWHPQEKDESRYVQTYSLDFL